MIRSPAVLSRWVPALLRPPMRAGAGCSRARSGTGGRRWPGAAPAGGVLALRRGPPPERDVLVHASGQPRVRGGGVDHSEVVAAKLAPLQLDSIHHVKLPVRDLAR